MEKTNKINSRQREHFDQDNKKANTISISMATGQYEFQAAPVF